MLYLKTQCFLCPLLITYLSQTKRYCVCSRAHMVFLAAARSSNSIYCSPLFEGKNSWAEGCCWFRHPLLKGWLIVHLIVLTNKRLHFLPSQKLHEHAMCKHGFMCIIFYKIADWVGWLWLDIKFNEISFLMAKEWFVTNISVFFTLQEYLEEYVGTKTRRAILYQVSDLNT